MQPDQFVKLTLYLRRVDGFPVLHKILDREDDSHVDDGQFDGEALQRATIVAGLFEVIFAEENLPC